MLQTTDSRAAGADFVRAAACLMVIGSHVAQRVSWDLWPQWKTNIAWSFMMGAWGVAVFFVLSGFLLSRPFWVALDKGGPMPSLRTYALRRAARILPGYWLALTVTFVLSITLLGVSFDTNLLIRFAAGFFLVSDWHWLTFFPVEFNSPLWSIGFEVTSYVLLPICLALLFLARPIPKGWTGRLLWIALIGGLILAQWAIVNYIKFDNHQRGWEYGPVSGAKFWMPRFNPIGLFSIFAIGMLAAGVAVMLERFKHLIFDLIALGGLALVAWSLWSNFPNADGWGLNDVPYGFPWFPLGVAIMLFATPSSVLLPRVTELPPIAFVARISFGLYVWHYFLMEIVRVLWQPAYVYDGMTNVNQWIWISTGVVALSFVIATLSFHFFESPILRWARGFETRPAPATPTLLPAAG